MRANTITFILLSIALFQSEAGSTEQTAALKLEAEKYEASNQLELAVKTIAMALEIDADDDALLGYASHLERRTGRHRMGLDHAMRAIEINPKVPWYYASAAYNANAIGDYVLVREYSQKYLAFDLRNEVNYRQVTDLFLKVSDRTYRIIWTLDPQNGILKDGGYEIPVPTVDVPYQTGRFEVIGAKSNRVFTRDGNDLVYVVPDGDKPFILLAEITFRPYCYLSSLNKAETGDLPDDVKAYLGKSEGIDPTNEVVARIGDQLKGKSTIDSIRNILSWMNRNLSYDLERVRTAEDVIAKSHGECGGWSLAFTAICRSIGIPAREVWGVTQLSDPENPLPPGHMKGHLWAEVYVRGCGWIPVEPQVPNQLGIVPANYIRMHHYDVNSFTWSDANPRPSVNIFRMGGDTPRFRELPKGSRTNR